MQSPSQAAPETSPQGEKSSQELANSQDLLNGVQSGPNGHDEGLKEVEQGMAGMTVQSENELHRLCAEGKLEELKAVLGRSLESLETLGEL